MCGLRFWPQSAETVGGAGLTGAVYTITASTNTERRETGGVASYATGADGFAMRVVEGNGVLHSSRPLRESDAGELRVTVSHGPQTLVMSVDLSVLPVVPLSYPVARTAADGYEGVVATIAVAGAAGAALSYRGGLDDSLFTLVAAEGASSGRAVLSLTAAARGPLTVTAKASFYVSHAGYYPATVTAKVALTVMGPFSAATANIQHNQSGVFHKFSIPGYANTRFADAANDQNFAVGEDGRASIAPGVALVTGALHTITAEGRDDFLGAALLTLEVSVWTPSLICPPGSETPPANTSQAELDIGLREAAYGGDMASACQYIRRGAAIDGKSSQVNESTRYNYGRGLWPLALAFHDTGAGKDRMGMARFLLENDADPDVHAHDTDGWAILHWAGAAETRLLLDYGADIEAISDYRRRTPLFEASYWGITERVELLLERGANPNSLDIWGYTPLHGAVFNYKYNPTSQIVEAVRLLLSNGADINLNSRYGRAPLDDSASTNRTAVLTAFLREHGGICFIRTYSDCGLIMRPFNFTVNAAANYSGVVHTVTATDALRPNAATIYSLIHGEGFSVNSEGVLSAGSGVLTAGLVATVSIRATTEGGTQSVTVEIVIKVSAASGGNAGLFHSPDVFQNPPLQLIPFAGNQLKPPKLVRVRSSKISEFPAKIILGSPPLPPTSHLPRRPPLPLSREFLSRIKTPMPRGPHGRMQDLCRRPCFG